MKRLLFAFAAMGLMSGTALAQDVCAPSAVSISTTTYYASIKITWNATGDDCTSGNATTKEVRYSTSPITDTNWQSASVVPGTTSSASNGNPDFMCLSLDPCATTTYYFAAFLIDDAGNRSPISNVVTGSARCSAPFELCE